MTAFLLDAAAFLLRWFHVVAAMAWIGESFYFVMLDRALKPPREGGEGIQGDLWSVHGGGFYHKRKFLLAPPGMPADLHWSMWKSYTTWITGFALLSVMYLASPQIYMIDPNIAAWTQTQAVGLALGFLALAWLGYDLLCRAVGFRDRLLVVLVAGWIIALSFLATELFSGRAAYLLVGAALGTIMSANVFVVIIPGQRRMVAALLRGETPDALPGKRGKQRSVHNTFFTLPVVFAMLSVHFAAASSHPHKAWILIGFMAVGALIRQFFVIWHSGQRAWGLLLASAVLLIGLLVWMAPAPRPAVHSDPVSAIEDGAAAGDPVSTVHVVDSAPVETGRVHAIFQQRCVMCHAAQPRLMGSAPLGAMFDTPQQVESYRDKIRQQVVVMKVMPPGNMTGLTDTERAEIDRWTTAVVARP
jgi:uncharacterized membrane protein